ncbi:hypothetical protein NMG60_11003004 [Bertholletia excelsa]
MDSAKRFLSLLLFAFLTGLASSTLISDDVFESHGLTGRGLLQVETACPVDFEHQNYTIITSQCKGPNYIPDQCCNALKQFACPHADAINDLKNSCAKTMFSYINLYGKYPPGLFSGMCREDKNGLKCDANATAPAKSSVKTNSNARSPMLMFAAAFLMLLL